MEDLKAMLMGRGAVLVGFAGLRGLAGEAPDGLPFGVSIAAAIEPHIVAGIRNGPTPEYLTEYNRLNKLLDKLGESAAELLRQKGHRAEPLSATGAGVDWETLRSRLPHKTVATRAGLGWVGKCALVVTEPYGSGVRFTSVLTDADLPAGRPEDESRCGECTACVDVCPAEAPTGRHWRAGMAREEIFDAFACFEDIRERAARRGDDIYVCGMCIAACPFTQQYLQRSGV